LTITPIAGGVVNFSGTVVQLRFHALGDPGADPTDYEVVVDVNAAPVHVEPFTMGTNTEIVAVLSVAVTAADTLAVRFRPASGGARTPNLISVRAQVINQAAAAWNFGDPLAAGTYCLETVV
jgi:hypothetical protein